MAREFELKLKIPESKISKVSGLSAVKKFRKGTVRRRRLFNIYYDTANGFLACKHMALRLRLDSGRWIMCLKASAKDSGKEGIHDRIEREWAVPRQELDRKILLEQDDFFDELTLDALLPVSETEFERSAWLLELPSGTTAELALDRGELRCGNRKQKFCEVEVELISGNGEDLLFLSEEIRKMLKGVPEPKSKSQRASEL